MNRKFNKDKQRNIFFSWERIVERERERAIETHVYHTQSTPYQRSE